MKHGIKQDFTRGRDERESRSGVKLRGIRVKTQEGMGKRKIRSDKGLGKREEEKEKSKVRRSPFIIA